MNDKQQLAAMGEHMREMEECKPEFKVPDGWSLVPNMPTPEMCAAFHRADADWEDGWAFDDNGNRHNSPVYQWAAMLAAAPEYKP